MQATEPEKAFGRPLVWPHFNSPVPLSPFTPSSANSAGPSLSRQLAPRQRQHTEDLH